jgi:hypothetical protein
MSPNPREGFYLVIHFAADGSAMFVTVGCGGTVLSGPVLYPLPDAELLRLTGWARQVVSEQWGGLEPFTDVIQLGARAPLPKAFEKATAFAKRVAAEDLASVDIDLMLYQAAERLATIYLAQLQGRDQSPGQADADVISAMVQPRSRSGRRQGFGLTAPERVAVEVRAMKLAAAHLASLGFQTTDVSAKEPFDFLATRGTQSLKVEVKGTTSDFCDSVLMTRNEVELHRRERGQTALVMVTGVRLEKCMDRPVASGGTVELLLNWDIELWSAEPLAYQVSRSR